QLRQSPGFDQRRESLFGQGFLRLADGSRVLAFAIEKVRARQQVFNVIRLRADRLFGQRQGRQRVAAGSQQLSLEPLGSGKVRIERQRLVEVVQARLG